MKSERAYQIILKVGGIPIGKDKYVITEIAKILTETVAKVYQATDKLGKSQYRHLLNVNCGGTIRVQHLWQTVRPSLTEKAISTVDTLTAEAIKTLLGKTELSEEAIAQSFMPVRFGGLGYRQEFRLYSGCGVYWGFCSRIIWDRRYRRYQT